MWAENSDFVKAISNSLINLSHLLQHIVAIRICAFHNSGRERVTGNFKCTHYTFKSTTLPKIAQV